MKEIEVDRFQFIYAGRDGDRFSRWIKENNLENSYQERGYLSRQDTLELQNLSHLQLVLTSATQDWGGVMTGKIFEYIESGNPVLVLIKGEKDPEFEEFMERTGAGIVCYDPPLYPTMLSDFIIKQYNSWKEGNIRSTLNEEYIERVLSWSTQMDRMLSALSPN